MGGSGKTLLAQMVNNNEEIQENFGKDSIFWITVGRDASISSLYVRMREYAGVEMSCETPLEDQRTHLMNVFSNRRVLLILDDMWDNVYEYKEMVEWLNVARGSGSVTLLTTRNLSIMLRIDASVEVLSLLSEEHNWVLFCTHAFGTNGFPSNQELMKLAKDVCNECKGLPLALKVIGSSMKSKDDNAEWRSTLQDLRKSNSTVDKNIEQQLFKHLQISYDQLDECTKTYFLYFAAYPEDSEIQTKELFYMWVVEDLFGDDLDAKDALDKARSILNELRKRSLVDDCKDFLGQKCVKMHDVLRDLAIRITRKDEEVVCENLFKPGMRNLKQFPSAWLGKPLKVKRMSLFGQNISRFPSNFIAPQLAICMIGAFPFSSLLPSSVQECVIEEGFFSSMTNIKYMQLCSSAILKNVPTTIGTLRFLQHLDMSHCRALEELPESIGELGSLQHLDLSYCEALKKLLENIKGLGSLQHLNMSYCEALGELPESIEGLGSLQHLDVNCCLVLKKLPQNFGELRSLQHLNMRYCLALTQLPESIEGLGSLQHLDMSCYWMLKKLPESIGGLGSLEHLDMSYCEGLRELPESIRGLGSLQHLDMNNCKGLREIPESIGGLGSLQHLDMSNCEGLRELPESIGGLGSLQHLSLKNWRVLKKLPNSIGGLGSLFHLNMSNCWMLKKLPESIEGLGSLQHLDMSNCEMLKELPESIGGLRSLQRLSLASCVALNELPKAIGALGSLNLLDMRNCEALKELPNFTNNFRLQILC